jgi:excinuclease UvrABC helicase subunit UvrB
MYEACARDTARNLRLFAFVRSHAQDERHKLQFDQWRPYVLMMHTRTVATPLLQQELYEDGLRVIEAGIEGIREFLDEYEQSHRAEECVELTSLERWRDEILTKEERAAAARPKTAAQVLRQQLEAAIAAEEFEEAARLRDQIRKLTTDN